MGDTVAVEGGLAEALAGLSVFSEAFAVYFGHVELRSSGWLADPATGRKSARAAAGSGDAEAALVTGLRADTGVDRTIVLLASRICQLPSGAVQNGASCRLPMD